MEYNLNGFKVLEEEPGWFYRQILTLYMDSHMGNFPSNEMNKISPCNVKKIGTRGRGAKTLINGDGIAEWICRSIRFSIHEKIKFINELKTQKLISHDFNIVCSTSESDFFTSLSFLLEEIYPNYSIKRQQCIDESIIVDCVLNDSIVIEFDEKMHVSYDYEAERIREEFIMNKGYSIVRIDDKCNIGKALGIILKTLKNEDRSNHAKRIVRSYDPTKK